jgi:flagella basal body P-ring formation protein FlgA
MSLLSLLAVVLGPAALLASGPCLSIEGDEVRARDLAVAIPELRRIDGEARVGYAPLPGMRRTFSPAALRAFARRFGILVNPESEVCVERQRRPLKREDVERALRSAGIEAEILEVCPCLVPSGRLDSLRSQIMAPGPSGADQPTMWRGRWLYADGKSLPVWAKVRLTRREQYLVASEDLPAGRPVEASQLHGEWKTGVDQKRYARDLAEVEGKAPRRRIRQGDLIPLALLAPAPAVKRGDTVEVSVDSGAARLRFQAQAETTGYLGGRVLLRNPQNGRRFQATVSGRRKAAIQAVGGSDAT